MAGSGWLACTEGIWSSRVGSFVGATTGARASGGGTRSPTASLYGGGATDALAGSAMSGASGDIWTGLGCSRGSAWRSRSSSIGCRTGAPTDDGAGRGSGANAAKGISSIKAGSIAASTRAGSSEGASGSGAAVGGTGSLANSPAGDGGTNREFGGSATVGDAWGSGSSAGGGASLNGFARVGSGANSTCATTPPAPPPAACGKICWGLNVHGKGSVGGLAGGAAGVASGRRG